LAVSVLSIEITRRTDYEHIIGWRGYLDGKVQQEFEASPQWQQFEAEFLAFSDSPHTPSTAEMSSENDLPKLSDTVNRRLELKWIDLLDKYHLAGEHLHWHEKAQSLRDSRQLVNKIGVAPSVSVAEHRFVDLANTYWPLWNPGTGHEVFVGWLDAIKRRTASEVEAPWKGTSDLVDRWYEKWCASAVENELKTRVREWTKRARGAELAYVERKLRTEAFKGGSPEKSASTAVELPAGAPGAEASQAPKPKLNTALINKWIGEEGHDNEVLAAMLKISPRTVSSLRNNGNYHGDDAVTKLANLMKRDPEDLYLPEASI
jgi:hypothetical protein